MPQIAQPNASRLSETVLEEVLSCLDLGDSCAGAVVHRDQHSNDFAEIRLESGEAVVVKRGRFDWSRPRFETSRKASELIRSETDLTVPEPLHLPTKLAEIPMEAYFRIDLPILQEIWPELKEGARAMAARSWGARTAQLHAIEADGFGPLATSNGARFDSLADRLRTDLLDRLLPAVLGEWPLAEPSVRKVAELSDEVEGRVGDRSRLLHGDLHMGNVLCERTNGTVSCVGLIDLETAQVGPPEADLAMLELHHGRLFDHPVDGRWLEIVREGYDRPLDDWTIHFYRAYHLLNMGFYSALIGHEWHAERVGEALEEELAKLSKKLFPVRATSGTALA